MSFQLKLGVIATDCAANSRAKCRDQGNIPPSSSRLALIATTLPDKAMTSQSRCETLPQPAGRVLLCIVLCQWDREAGC